MFFGTGAKHRVLVASDNCRPAKEVFDATIENVTRYCSTLRSCPPFYKEYSNFSAQTSLYEVVPGIGLGCLISTSGVNVTFRSKQSPTDAGNFVEALDALLAAEAVSDSFVKDGSVWMPPITDKFWSNNVGSYGICPN